MTAHFAIDFRETGLKIPLAPFVKKGIAKDL